MYPLRSAESSLSSEQERGLSSGLTTAPLQVDAISPGG
jgi:hypothetical protein